MSKNSARRSSSGYTLVEAMVGLLLSLVVLAGGFSAYSMGIHFAQSSRDEVRATQFAQSKMEEMRTMNWNDLVALPEKSTFEAEGIFAKEFSDRYTGILEIETINASQKLLRCRVSWEARTGRKTQIYETVFTKDGLNDYFVRSF